MSDTTRAMIELQCSYCGNHHSYSPEMCRDMYVRPVTVTSTCDFCPRLKQAEAREAKLRELVGRLRDYLNEVNDDHRYYNDDTEPLIDEIDAALATVKEGK